MKKRHVKRSWINKDQCIGNALCLRAAGALIDMDYTKNTASIIDLDREYSDQESEDILQAMEICPAKAIFVELSDGSVHCDTDTLPQS